MKTAHHIGGVCPLSCDVFNIGNANGAIAPAHAVTVNVNSRIPVDFCQGDEVVDGVLHRIITRPGHHVRDIHLIPFRRAEILNLVPEAEGREKLKDELIRAILSIKDIVG